MLTQLRDARGARAAGAILRSHSAARSAADVRMHGLLMSPGERAPGGAPDERAPGNSRAARAKATVVAALDADAAARRARGARRERDIALALGRTLSGGRVHAWLADVAWRSLVRRRA